MEINKKTVNTFIVYLFFTSYMMVSSFVFWLDFIVLPFRIIIGIINGIFNLFSKQVETKEAFRFYTEDLFEKPEKYRDGIAKDYSCRIIGASTAMYSWALIKVFASILNLSEGFIINNIIIVMLICLVISSYIVIHFPEKKEVIKEINQLLHADKINRPLCFLCFFLIVFGGLGCAYYVCFV
ncbi:MAG: hypothetical protein IKR18_11930 [Bacteroidaceae bacterium]|nr:hypothetical protein [Bacteroidaceae bacterium]